MRNGATYMQTPSNTTYYETPAMRLHRTASTIQDDLQWLLQHASNDIANGNVTPNGYYIQ